MEVILLERVERLGKIGDTVNVKGGFARNFLLPNGKALRATKESRAFFEQERQKFEELNDASLAEAKLQHEKVDGKSWTLIRQASEAGQLYGSVNSRDIVALLAEEGCTINRSQVMISQVIKALGIHEARVRLHPEVVIKVQLNVARSDEDALGQLEALTAEQQAQALSETAAQVFEDGVAPTIEDDSEDITASAISPVNKVDNKDEISESTPE